MSGKPRSHNHLALRSSGAFRGTCTLAMPLTLFLASITPLQAQQELLPVFHFNHLSAAEDGLPSDEIRANVVRDRDGYVWIGTTNGLARFDGYGCKNYRHIRDAPSSLASNSIMSLMTDRKGRLWVGTFETGLSLYDASRERFLNFPPHGSDSTWYEGKYVPDIMEDRAGGIWFIALPGNLVRVNLPGQGEDDDLDSLAGKIRFAAYALRAPATLCGGLCERADGTIVVGTDSGLVIFDPRSQSFSRPRFLDEAGRQLNSSVIQCLFNDTHGYLWAGTAANGIFQLDWENMHVRNYAHRDGDGSSIRSNDISGIVEDRTGHLWIQSTRGLDRFSPESGKRAPYLPFGWDPRSTTSLKVAIDSSGTLWFGQFTDGVCYLSPTSLRLPHYSIPRPDGYARQFESIERDHAGNVWLSSLGAVYQVDISSLRILKVIDVFRGKAPIYGNFDGRATFCDATGHLWYGTWGLGLYRVDLASGQVKNYRYAPKFAADCVVRSVAPGDGGSIWVAGEYEGLMHFDPSSGKFQRTSIPYASNVTKDRSGKIWVSSDLGGLYVHDPATGKTERFAYDSTNRRSLSSDRTRLTYEDPFGRIWVGAGPTINLWDPATRSFSHFSNRAFPNALYAMPIGTDSEERLWVMHTGGNLSILDPSRGNFTNFAYSDGICGSVRDMESLQDGRILLTGSAGINIVDPDSIDSHPTPPPLVITRMAINDEPVTPSQLSNQSGSMRFSYLQNTLEFEFAAIDIDAPYLVRYRYQLEGLEKDWVTTNDRRFVRYASLPPGDYVFHVKAVSLWGAWSDQDTTLAFRIDAPWWRTSWAYSFYGLLIVLFLFAGYRLRLRQVFLRQEAEMQRFQADHLAEVDKLKSRFFANISHEFRTPLTLILGPIRQAIERPDDPDLLQKLHLVEDNTKQLHGLVNQLLDFSRVESGTMKLQVSRSDIVQFFRRVVMSFESWAERKHINLEFTSGADALEAYFDRDKLEKIVNNLMSNALKFTAEGGAIEAQLRVSHSPPRPLTEHHEGQSGRVGERVIIAITDTGRGIAAEHLPHIFDRFYRFDETHITEGTGIGLALAKELVDLHHGTISAESSRGRGSTFTVALPISRTAYRTGEISESPVETEPQEPIVSRTAQAQPEHLPAATPTEGKPIVLVVEDNPDLRRYIREYLEQQFAVREARNGKEGCDQAFEIIPDIVVSDVMMPEMDGMELCRTLKQDVRTSHVPVILLTARAGTDSKIDGLEIGADDYVTKPFETKELGARMRNLIEQRRLLRKKFSEGVVLKPGEVAVSSLDDTLLKKVMASIETNIGDENFGVDDLAREACLSRAHLNRKLRALTDVSPAELIKQVRLERGRQLLEKNAGSIAEIAYQVGFGSPSRFSASFRERFGIVPSEVNRHKV